MQEKNCTNCRFHDYLEEKKIISCWQHPRSITEPCSMSIECAKDFICDNYRSQEKIYCTDCKFKFGDCCRHAKLISITSDNFVNLHAVSSFSSKCEFFVEG